MHYLAFSIIILIALSTGGYANIIWPELFIAQHYFKALWLIGLSLLIEWPFVKYVTKYSWLESLIPLVLANFVTFTLGIIVAVAGGFAFTVIVDFIGSIFISDYMGTFSILGWIMAGFFFAFSNAIFELGTIALISKHISRRLRSGQNIVTFSKKNFLLIFIANFLSVSVTLLDMHYQENHKKDAMPVSSKLR